MNASEQTPVLRDDDSGLGTRVVEPPKFRPVTEKERSAHQQEVDAALQEKAEAMLSSLQAREGWKIPRPVRRAGTLILLALAAMLGLFLVTQVVQFVADIHALPVWSRTLAQACLILFGGILVFLFAGLLWGIVRLQRSPRIHLKALARLSERQELQAIAQQKQTEARGALEDYLRNYQLTAKLQKRFTAIGMTEEEWSSLESAKARLLDANRPATSPDWLEEFELTFLGILDRCAKRRVAKYAFRVGAGTAASPMAMVDQMIVLYGSTAMIKELFCIYHLRPAAGQTLVLLTKSLTHTYLSGMAEAATESVADWIAETLPDAGTALVGGGLKFVGAKSAEGLLNANLIRRLGSSSVSMLQPINKRKVR